MPFWITNPLAFCYVLGEPLVYRLDLFSLMVVTVAHSRTGPALLVRWLLYEMDLKIYLSVATT